MKKIIQYLFMAILLCTAIPITYGEYINDNIYTYYYGATCSHCIKVENYLKESGVDQRINIIPKEVQINRANAQELLTKAEDLGIPTSQVGTPFIVVQENDGTEYALIGEVEALDHFKLLEEKIKEKKSGEQNNEPINEIGSEQTTIPGRETSSGTEILSGTETEKDSTTENDTTTSEDSLRERIKFFFTIVPAALVDSINPCAFAVMLLLLTSILSKTASRKKALQSGIMFSLAIFITYFLLGMGVLKLLGNMESLFWLKRIVGIVGLLVGLANLKDYFRYGKGFIMEVPMSRRPLMQKIIKKVTSPMGAFIVGVVVSLFLLPCSSGPYLTILGYLSSESQTLNVRGYTYLTVYNLIFILPMLAIAALIGFGYSTAEKIGQFKNKNTKLIHLIVGLLMLGLGIYIIGTLYRR